MQSKCSVCGIKKSRFVKKQEAKGLLSNLGIVTKLLNITRKKKKKLDKILMLAKSKLNSVETLISQVLIGMDISHEEFITILKEKYKYEKMKDNLRSENEEQASNDISQQII